MTTVSAARSTESGARLARIRDRLAATGEQDAVLRVMLVLAHEAVRAQSVADEAPAVESTGDTKANLPATGYTVSPGEYAELVARIREIVGRTVPSAASILVVSRGDENLLVPGFDATHFPQGPNGIYAGYYPADSDAAIAHLEQCRSAGAEFLVLPATGYWWLDYYDRLAQHLLARSRVAHHDAHCLIFDLHIHTQEGDLNVQAEGGAIP
jgi:hypothetical protein